MKHLGRVLVLGLLILGMVGGASAEIRQFDGFEDGDYTSSPSWYFPDAYSSSASNDIQVQSSTVYEGSNALQLGYSSEFNIGIATLSSNLDANDGSSVSAWMRQNSTDGYSAYYGVDAGAEGEIGNILSSKNEGAQIVFTNDGSIVLVVGKGDNDDTTTILNSYQADTWYKAEIEFVPSQNKVTGYVYDVNGNLEGSASMTDYYTGDYEFNRTIVHNNQPTLATSFFDNVDTAFNRPPQFNSSSITPDPPLIGETADFSYNASDPDGSIQSVDLTLKDDGTQIFSGTKNSATGTFSPPDTLTEGDITATFTATDDRGAETTKTITKTLSDTSPTSPNINKPTGTLNTATTNYNITLVSDADNVPDESLTVTLNRDGNQVKQLTANEGSKIIGSFQTSTEGNHILDVTVSESDGQTATGSSTYKVEFIDPTINSFSIDNKPLLIGSKVSLNFSASDNQEIADVSLKILKNSNTQKTLSISFNSKDVSGTFTDAYSLPTAGTYDFSLKVTDNQGETDKKTITKTLQDNKPEFSIGKPVDNKLQGTKDIQVELNNTEDDDKPGENPTVNLKIDGTIKQSFTVEDTEDFTRTVTGKEGSQVLTVEMVEGDGDTRSKSRTVEVDTTPPKVNISSPEQSLRTNSTSGIPLEFTRSDPNLDTSTCKYSKDLGTNISLSSCTNTTIQFSEIGTHNLTVYVSDSLGNTGKDSSTFQVDILNDLTVENKATNTALKNYTATITNGTKTIGGFQTDKAFQFFTGELPKGDINATVTKDGFQVETQKFTGVDNTFNQDISFELERSGLNIQVLDEQTNSKILGPKKVEISNSTDTLEYFYGNQYIGQDFGTEVADGDVNTKTGFSDKNIGTDEKRTAQVSVSLGRSSSETINVKHSFEDNGGNGNFAHTTLKKIEAETEAGNFETIYENSVGNTNNEGIKTTIINLDNSNGKYSGLLKVTGLIDSDDDFSTRDFNLYEVYANNLNNLDRQFPNYPTGNVEITVDDNFNDQYRSRTVETTLDSTTKLNLDAYLLEKGQGIFTTVEVLENEQDQLKNAEVRIRRNFDGDFKTVATDRTATDGTAGFFLDPDTQYQASVSKTGFQTFQGTFSPVNYQADPFKVALGKEGDFLRSNVYDSVKFKIQPRTQSVNKTVTEFNFTVSDLEAQISDLGINLSNGDTKAISGTPSGGTVLLESNLSKSNLSDLELTAFFVKDGERYNIERTYNLRDPINPGIASITNVAGKLSSLGNTTRSLLAVLLSGFVAFSLKSKINRKGGSLVTLSSLGIFVLIGWLPAFYWLLTLLTVIGLLAMR